MIAQRVGVSAARRAVAAPSTFFTTQAPRLALSTSQIRCGGIKFLVAWPFMFHCINGVRHLTYDLGLGFAKKQIAQYGWIVWGSSLVAGLYTAFLL
ncbi:hypothetical protein VdG1_05070 [Verticillium dahliae VDG1]|nr:hypothetical protein VdG1_05070 [Verticillium dahliae VDG1]